MSPDPGTALLAALGCGTAGLGVPALVARLPGPPGEVASMPGVRRRSVLLGAVAGAVVGGCLGPDWALLVLLPLVPVGVALGLVDAQTHLLPTRLIWPSLAVAGALAAVASLLSGDWRSLVEAALAGTVTLVAFHTLWWLFPAGMGYGDVRLSVLVGFGLGYVDAAAWLLGLYSAFVIFAVVGVGRAVRRRQRSALREALPFGPFLLAGALAGIALSGYLASG
jgi:leader peptidase (prepilin peptidase)/N-methyltransferase